MEKIILSTLSLEDIAVKVAEKVLSLQQINICQPEEPNEPEFLTILQAAELLKLAKPTIYGLTHRNEIPFFKKGKKLYFKKTELIDWLNSGRKLTKTEIRHTADHFLHQRKKRLTNHKEKSVNGSKNPVTVNSNAGSDSCKQEA